MYNFQLDNESDLVEIRTSSNVHIQESSITDGKRILGYLFSVDKDDTIYVVQRNHNIAWNEIVPFIIELLSLNNIAWVSIQGLTYTMWEGIHSQIGILNQEEQKFAA